MASVGCAVGRPMPQVVTPLNVYVYRSKSQVLLSGSGITELFKECCSDLRIRHRSFRNLGELELNNKYVNVLVFPDCTNIPDDEFTRGLLTQIRDECKKGALKVIAIGAMAYLFSAKTSYKDRKTLEIKERFNPGHALFSGTCKGPVKEIPSLSFQKVQLHKEKEETDGVMIMDGGGALIDDTLTSDQRDHEMFASVEIGNRSEDARYRESHGLHSVAVACMRADARAYNAVLLSVHPEYGEREFKHFENACQAARTTSQVDDQLEMQPGLSDQFFEKLRREQPFAQEFFMTCLRKLGLKTD